MKPTKAQAYHTEMVMAMRRRQYKDHVNALNEPDVIERIREVQKVSPNWQPKFRK